MTGADAFLVGMAVVDLIALVAMGVVAMRYMASAKAGQAMAAPAMSAGKLLAERGKAFAAHASERGGATAAHVKEVVGNVKRRADNTARLARELKPAAQEAEEAVRNGHQDLVRQVTTAKDWAARLNRIRVAAGAATRAANEEPAHNGTGPRSAG